MRTSTRERCVREADRGGKRAEHPAADAEREEKRADPDGRVDAARDADHPEQEEQGGEEEKTHELFHPHHPGTGPRDEAEPGRLRAEEQIGRAHSRRDREKHEEDDRGRLREGEPERGPEIGRGAGRGEHGREDALEERAGVTFARAPAEPVRWWLRPGV